MRTTQRLKGQSAMEYLMTYGWAILIVIIVAAVLFSLGVFNPATYQQTAATGLAGFNAQAGGFQLDSTGGLTLQLTNGVGANIVIKGAPNIPNTTVTAGATTAVLPADVLAGPGQTVTLTFSGLGIRTAGSAYSADVSLVYDNSDTGLTGFRSTGTLSGTVS